MSSTDPTRISDPLASAPTVGVAMAEVPAPVIEGVTIERELGRGGMGAVWLGRQTYLDRRVAVKALTVHGDEVFAARFRREARILAGLAHPHIVACHQAGMAPDGRPFLVMEFVDGPDLKQHLAAHGPLAPAEAARLVGEIAEGLRHAHAQGIIHRDVKPENVLLAKRADGTWTAKLADLGLARTSQAVKGAHDLTAAGQVLGTPATMAPEQFDHPDAVDHRADIYGLGCVLHHALTGEPAFTGNSFADLIVSKVNGPVPDPARLRAGLPGALTALCRSMLARDRERRPGYDAVIAALRVPQAAARGPGRGVLRALGVVLAAGVVALLLWPRRSEMPPVAMPDPVRISAPPAAAPVPVVPPRASPAPEPGLPALAAPEELFNTDFTKRLAGWNIADPIAWGVSEDVEGFPVSGRGGEIVRPLKAMPGRITGSVSVPEGATRVLIGVRDGEGRTTGLLIYPLNGLIASMVAQAVDGSAAAGAGSATMSARRVQFSLTLGAGRLTAVLRDAAVSEPLVIALPAPPVSIVLAAEGRMQTLFQDLRAEP